MLIEHTCGAWESEERHWESSARDDTESSRTGSGDPGSEQTWRLDEAPGLTLGLSHMEWPEDEKEPANRI